MEIIDFNDNWEFVREAPGSMFIMNGRNGKEIVNLPHDANIGLKPNPNCPQGSQVGYFEGCLGLYTKYFFVPDEWQGKLIHIELDGSYCNTEIYLNGSLMGFHPNGYMLYICDLTDKILYGRKNRFAIFVNSSMSCTDRWYSGAGIYRGVSLRVADRVHIAENGVFCYTQKADKNAAILHVQAEIINRTEEDKQVEVNFSLHRDLGRNVPYEEQPCGKAASVCTVPAMGSAVVSAEITVQNPELWSLDSPNLYNVKAVLSGADCFDEETVLFGIRTITTDAKYGLLLNGMPVKLKGGCVHHTNGILGSAAFYDAELRKVRLHKENGFNAIRCSHNPFSKEFMEACDRLGILVYAEAFDMWAMPKNINDYHLYFDCWWERDLTAFIKRDRNHPCVFCWSIGNEIIERNGLQGVEKYTKLLAAKTRELDPSRAVSGAIPAMFNGMSDDDTLKQIEAMRGLQGPVQNLTTPWSESVWLDRTKEFSAPLDIVGYNYLSHRYKEDGERLPQRVICGTESYNKDVKEVWDEVMKYPFVIGDFCWTSQDYLGETGISNIIFQNADENPPFALYLHKSEYPDRTANCGCMDILGFGLPALHYRKIVWGSDETYIAVQHPKRFGKVSYRTAWAFDECENSWNYPDYEGEPIHIEVYSRAEEVELYLNGKNIGSSKAGYENDYKAKFDVTYSSGTLVAKSFTAGKEISSQQIQTWGTPEKIEIIPDKTELYADGQSLAFVEIRVCDKAGNLCADAELSMVAQVEGNATLQAFGSAKNSTEELYTEGKFTSYKGRLMAVVRSGKERGEAVLIVTSEKLGTAKIKFQII